MPVLDGIAATRRLRAEQPDVRVIALTTFDDDEDVFAALRAGAVGLPAQGRLVGAGWWRRCSRPRAASRCSSRRWRRRWWPGSPGCPPTTPSPARSRSWCRCPSGSWRCSGCWPTGGSNREIAAALLPRRGHGQEPRHQRARQARRPRPHPGGARAAPGLLGLLWNHDPGHDLWHLAPAGARRQDRGHDDETPPDPHGPRCTCGSPSTTSRWSSRWLVGMFALGPLSSGAAGSGRPTPTRTPS